ncbi:MULTISPECIES: TonB-dependent receptor plug domain-containing protein [Chitinophagaceae]
MKLTTKKYLLLAIGASLTFPGLVSAQGTGKNKEREKTMDSAVSNLETVVVTGTRRKGRTNISSAVPVDVIPLPSLTKEIGQTDLNQILTFLAPSFQSSRQTISDGTDHIDPAQLRGMGSDQVLVLVNGKRRHQSALVNVNGTVNRGQVGTDLSAIPPTAIERVEVLRDGAAAQYGSDAIAGVINIVLKKQTGQLTGNVSYGQNVTSYDKNYALEKLSGTPASNIHVNDGGVFQTGLNYGFRLGNKGFLNISGEYDLRDASNRTGTYTGQIYPNVNGANRDDSIMSARGTSRNTFDMRIGNSKIASGAVFLNGEYALNSLWKIVLFGGYSKKNGESAGLYRYPASIVSSGGTYASDILSIYPDGFLPLIKTNIQDYSLSGGLVGTLGGWDASLTNTFGLNTFDYTIDNSINYTQFAVSSTPQSKFDAGGIKFLQNTVNLDLNHSFDVLSGLNLAFGSEFRIDQYGQRAGEEASYANYNTSSGASAGAQVFSGFLPNNAGTHNRSAVAFYSDVELDVTKKLLVGGALRFENYSDFGSTINYKATARYKLTPWFVVRGGASSGFRAPSMQQRFYAKTNTLFVTQSGGSLVPIEAGTFTNDSKAAELLGIPKLKQETSKNYSAGIALTPFKGLEFTLDGYYVKINNRIILTNNFTGGTDANLSAQLSAAGAGTANFFTNAVNTSYKGLEAVLSYNTRIDKSDLRFTAAGNFMKNRVAKDKDGNVIIHASDILINSGQLGNYFNREDESRFEVAAPSSKISYMVNYRLTKFFAMARATSFGKVTYLDGANGFSQNIVLNAFDNKNEATDQVFKSKTIFDLSMGYDFIKNMSFTIGASNLFDTYPDKQSHSANVSSGRFIYSRRVQQMGFNGRFLFAKLAFNF